MLGKEFFPHFSAELSVRKVSFVSRFYIRFSSRRAAGRARGIPESGVECQHREKLLERNKRGKGAREPLSGERIERSRGETKQKENTIRKRNEAIKRILVQHKRRNIQENKYILLSIQKKIYSLNPSFMNLLYSPFIK